MVSNKQGTWKNTLLSLHGADLQMKCEKIAVVRSSLKQLEEGSEKVLEEMLVVFTLIFKGKFPVLQIH